MKQVKRKRVLPLLLSFAVVLAMCTGAAVLAANMPEGEGEAAGYSIGENDVCRIGDTGYTSLKDAFASEENEAEVVLVKDITGLTKDDIAVVPEGKAVILNMSGKSITVDPAFEGRPIINRGTLTVTGNGTIDSSASEFGGYGAIDDYGTLIIENGTFRGSVMANGADIKVRPEAEAVIRGGLFEGATCAVYSEGKLTIHNGTFVTTSCNQTKDSQGNGGHWAYCINSRGELYFYDGSVTGVQGGLGISNGYAEVKGGTFKTVGCEHSAEGAYSFYALYIAGEVGVVEAHISGGSYESASRVAVLCGNDNLGGDGGINAKATAYITGGTFVGGGNSPAMQAGKNTGDPNITGGKFSSDVSAYVPAGNQVMEQDGKYIVVIDEETAVAKIGTAGYTTLQAAVDAAGEKAVITLLQQTITESIEIPAEKTVTLDLNGCTLKNSGAKHTIINKGDLTITGDGTVDNVNHGKAAIYNDRTGHVTILRGTFTRSNEAGVNPNNNGGNSFYVIQNLGTMTIGEEGADNSGIVVTANGGYSSLIANGYYNGKNETNTPTLTIYGGQFSGGINVVKNDDRGELTIMDGTFSNTYGPAIMNWNVAVIHDGTFTVNHTASAVLANGYYDNGYDQGILTIQGGTFTASNNGTGALFGYGVGSEKGGSLAIADGTFNGSVLVGDDYPYQPAISGGTYTTAIPAAYCADDFHPHQNEDGTYSVHIHEAGTEWVSDEAQHWNICTICDEKVNAAAHESDEGVVTTPATETTEGVRTYSCTVCGHVLRTEPIPVLPHTHNYDSAWNFDDENHWHECTCGDKADIAAHQYGDWSVTKEATETEDGSKEKACSVCGHKVVEVIPATGTQPDPGTGDFSSMTVVLILTALAVGVTGMAVLKRKRRTE